jgi:hypothetical protein
MKKLFYLGMLAIMVIALSSCAGYSPGKFVDDGGYTCIEYADGSRYQMPSGDSGDGGE